MSLGDTVCKGQPIGEQERGENGMEPVGTNGEYLTQGVSASTAHTRLATSGLYCWMLGASTVL